MAKSLKKKVLFRFAISFFIVGICFVGLPFLYLNVILPQRESNILAEENIIPDTVEFSEPTLVLTDTSSTTSEDNKEATTKTKETIEVKIPEIKASVEDYFPLIINIPKLSITWEVNEGTDIKTLKKGPGHIKGTSLPGQNGRVAISGHRTTYGAPFNRLDELNINDEIYLTTKNGLIFVYEVTGIEVVKPEEVEILIGSDKKELLLTTCTPKFSATRRLIVISQLKSTDHY